MTRALLTRMFRTLTGERITNKRYAQLFKEFSSGEDELVESEAVKLVNDYGVIFISEGLVIEEEVIAW